MNESINHCSESSILDISNATGLSMSEVTGGIVALNNLLKAILECKGVPEIIRSSCKTAGMSQRDRDVFFQKIRRIRGSDFNYSITRIESETLKNCIYLAVSGGLLNYDFDKTKCDFIYNTGSVGEGVYLAANDLINKHSYNDNRNVSDDIAEINAVMRRDKKKMNDMYESAMKILYYNISNNETDKALTMIDYLSGINLNYSDLTTIRNNIRVIEIASDAG